ncbi:MAG: hypothetical protein CXT68_04140 [Methanobacteriota archaeon]|nr:MAG: hypothetical protein CXT68_04140 [Euryarchaeota archaeon]
MDAQEYYQSLLAQGYKSEDSVAFTQQHYPGFTLAPTAEAAPSQMPFPAPVQMPGISTETGVGQIIVVGKSKGKALGIISGSIGIVMSIAILVWMTQMVNAQTSDNIDTFSDEGGSPAETLVSALKTLQFLSYLSIALLVGTIGISILTMLKKSKWWYLPAITFTVLLLLVGMSYYTAISVNQYYHDEGCDSEIYSNCEEMKYTAMWDTDVMFSGYCNGFALIFIGLLSLMSKPKPNPDETIEKEEVWVKAAWVIAIIVMIFGSMATFMVHSAFMNPIGNEANSGVNGFEFSGVDDEAFLDGQNNNTLLHITMDQGSGLNFASLSVKIVVDGGAYWRCELYSGSDSDGGCVIYQDWDDHRWDVGEEITILENGDDLCDGSGSGYCKVVVTIAEIDYSSGEGTVLQVLTIIVY